MDASIGKTPFWKSYPVENQNFLIIFAYEGYAMERKRILQVLLLGLLLLLPLAAAAQGDTLHLGHLVRGRVTDGRNGQPLEAVHVYLPGRHHATVTNADGRFTLKSDAPITTVIFSHLGYKTRRVKPGNGPMEVELAQEALALDGAAIISGNARHIVEEAISRIRDNYPSQPELLSCFYRETVRKRSRYTYVSEAVARLYKNAYTSAPWQDRSALDKSRILISQRRRDTLSVKMQGGPTQALLLDAVKNRDLLFDADMLPLYSFEMDFPQRLEGRLHYVIRLHPAAEYEYALYDGTLYIDSETLCFSRIELSMDMADPVKATRLILVRKPLSLRFRPREVSLVLTYRRHEDGLARLSYLRSVIRFDCDWRRRLFSTPYPVVNELVVTDKVEPAVPIAREDMFRQQDILNDKAAEFLDPAFWEDYNIIEPSESLEHAIDRLKKRR